MNVRATLSTTISNSPRVSPWMRSTLGLVLLVLPAIYFPASGDMPSHAYNAWLTQQVTHGLAGFKITAQYTNIATDMLLLWLLPLGPVAAMAAVNVLTVLVFFLGGYAFIRVYTGSCSLYCISLLAVFTYGVMYWLGFTNFMLGCGFAFLALACGKHFCRITRWLFPFCLVATFFMHLFVFAWALGACVILLGIPRLPTHWHTRLNLAALALSLAPLPFLYQRYVHLWGFSQIKSIF